MNVMTNTRRNFLAGVGAAALLSTTVIRPARAQSAADGSLASLWKDMELIDADGDSFSIADGRKPLTLIKLWANWCPVCIKEVAALDALVAAVGPQNLDVVLISHPSWFAGDQATAQSRGVRYKLATPGAQQRARAHPGGIDERGRHVRRTAQHGFRQGRGRSRRRPPGRDGLDECHDGGSTS